MLEDRTTVIQFSGGRDSLVLLHTQRHRLQEPNVFVLYADSGNAFDHVRQFVFGTGLFHGIKIAVVGPETSSLEWTEQEGLPSDIVPAWAAPDTAWMNRVPPRQIVQSPINCCARNLWIPMQQFIHRVGATLVLRGTRQVDYHRGIKNGTEFGVEYDSPLWDWSDDEIEQYIETHDLILPEHYPRVKESLDCWGCTAYLNTPAGLARLRYIKQHHADKWSILSDRLRRLRGVVADESRGFGEMLKEIEHG